MSQVMNVQVMNVGQSFCGCYYDCYILFLLFLFVFCSCCCFVVLFVIVVFCFCFVAVVDFHVVDGLFFNILMVMMIMFIILLWTRTMFSSGGPAFLVSQRTLQKMVRRERQPRYGNPLVNKTDDFLTLNFFIISYASSLLPSASRDFYW